MATNDQWERLLQVIEADQTGDERLRAKVLSFGKKIGMEIPDQLFQIRDGYSTITWPLALKVHEARLACDPYLLMGLKRPPITGSLTGAWTYRKLLYFTFGFWETEQHYLGNYEEYLFLENDTVEIVSQNESATTSYSFDPLVRHLQIGKQHYYVSQLKQNQLELIYGCERYVQKIQLERIPDGKLHIIPDLSKEEVLDAPPAGMWLLDKEFSRGEANESWIETHSCSNTTFQIWDFYRHGSMMVYKFGQQPREYDIKSLYYNKFTFYFGKDKCYNVHIEVENKNSIWLYFLVDHKGIPSESLKKYHFIRWNNDRLQGFNEFKWWLVNQALFGKNADKYPLEYLELWHQAADETVTVFDNPNFLEYLDNNADERHSGAYAFAHAFTNNSILRHTPEEAGELYRQFLAILDMWLQLRKKDRIIKYIRLFGFSKYPEYIKTLQAEIDRINEEKAE